MKKNNRIMEPTRAKARGSQRRNTKAAFIPALKGGVFEWRSIKPNANLIFTTIDNKEVILINIRKGKYYILNDTLSHIWNLITAGYSLEKIVAIMGNKYNIAPSILKQNIRRIFKKMMKLKLIDLH